MTDLTQVTYCGLYCGLCGQRNRIPARAAALREAMQREGWDQWGREAPQFEAFWSYLSRLVDSEADCSCRSGTCGDPACDIRTCARERDVTVCPTCADYPCARVERLAQTYTHLLGDGRRLAEVGLERWIAEQEARRATGFAYADIRCPGDEAPSGGE